MNQTSQNRRSYKTKTTIFQNIGVNFVSENSEESQRSDNEEVRKHLEKMSKEMKLENEMQVFFLYLLNT